MSEEQITEQEFSNPTNLGDQVLVNNSIFNEGASVGNYAHVQGCTINGTLRVEGSNCIITNCYVTGTSDHGIFIDGGHNYQPREKFTDEINERAWNLVAEHMTTDQYFAFMEGSTVELENKDRVYRLLLEKTGDFVILQGIRGEGIVATKGRIRSHDYPLGDEIVAFLEWFNHKTKELISQWNCGTYGIVKEGERR